MKGWLHGQTSLKKKFKLALKSVCFSILESCAHFIFHFEVFFDLFANHYRVAYTFILSIARKFKGSGSNEWVPVVRNEKGIEFSPPVNGPNYTLNIAYNPVLHDGGYRCFGSFYTVGWKSENGRENGESNTATLQCRY